MDRSRIERHVKPLIGKKAVSNLTLDDMENLQADIASGKTARPRGGKGGMTVGGGSVAGRTLGMLHTILEHAVRRRKITANPAKGARRIVDQKRKDRLSPEQIVMLGKAMRDMENESQTGLSVIRLMLLTGFRRNEALGLKKEWLLESGGVDFPDTKSGSQIRPVGRSAMELLRNRPKESGSQTEWLFPADRGNGHFIGIRKVLNRVAKCAGITCTPHVLRHTFSSVAGDLGYSELTIAGLLGHATKGVTAGYVHLDRVLVAAADHVSGVIAAHLDGQAEAKIFHIEAVK
jgi:integrase